MHELMNITFYTFEWTKQLQNIIKRFLTNFRYFYYVNIVYLEYLIVNYMPNEYCF